MNYEKYLQTVDHNLKARHGRVVNVLAWVALELGLYRRVQHHHHNSQITNFGFMPTPHQMNPAKPET